MILKRYLVFSGSIYYPAGGMEDFIGDFEREEEAIKATEEQLEKEHRSGVWGHIWDSKTRCIIWSKEYEEPDKVLSWRKN